MKLERLAVYDRRLKKITITDSCELKEPGTYELPLASFEEFKELSPGVWTAGGLRIEIKGTGGDLEYSIQSSGVKLRTAKTFRLLNCRFKGMIQKCCMTVTITPLDQSPQGK